MCLGSPQKVTHTWWWVPSPLLELVRTLRVCLAPSMNTENAEVYNRGSYERPSSGQTFIYRSVHLPSILSPTMCRSQAMSVAVSLDDLPLLWTPLGSMWCTPGFPHWQVLPSGGGKIRGSPAGWDLDWSPARSWLRVTSVGSLGSKPLCLNVSPWMKQHRWCIWQQQQVLHGEEGVGGTLSVAGTSSLPRYTSSSSWPSGECGTITPVLKMEKLVFTGTM